MWARRHADLDRVLHVWRAGVGAVISAATTVALGGFALLALLTISAVYTNESLRMGYATQELGLSLAAGEWAEPGSTAGRWRDNNGHVMAIAAGCIGVVFGAVLMVIVPHLKRIWVWGLAIALVLACVGAFHAAHVVELQDVQSGAPAGSGFIFDGDQFRTFNATFVGEWLIVLAMLGVASVVGVPLGAVAQRRIGRVRVWLRGRLRRTMRLSRTPN